MITKPTVFILGAGASNSYSYPAGDELKQIILSDLNGGHTLYIQCRQTHFQEKDINFFREDFKKSNKPTIDEFLESRADYSKIGKFCIAAVLLRYEREQALYNPKLEDNWFGYIFDKMKSSFEDFDKNRISFVTFNYDRSLECLLLNAVKSSFGKNDTEALDKIKKIKIIHLHGILNNLFPNEKNFRMYGVDVDNFDAIKGAAEQIRIISEGATSDDVYQLAIKEIFSSEEVYILGTAYHTQNIDRLNLRDMPDHIQIRGSAFQLLEQQVENVKKKLNKGILDRCKFGTSADKNTRVLKRHLFDD